MTSRTTYLVRAQLSCCLNAPADFTAPLRRSVQFRQSRNTGYNALFEGLTSYRVLSSMDGCQVQAMLISYSHRSRDSSEAAEAAGASILSVECFSGSALTLLAK